MAGADNGAHTDEKAFNVVLAQALGVRHPRWEVAAEQSGVLRGESGKQPDIIITPKGGMAGTPVVIETEYAPAATVDADAAGRLGKTLKRGGHVIERVVALKIPKGLEHLSGEKLHEAIGSAEFGYRLVSSTRSEATSAADASGEAAGTTQPALFPEKGWIVGTADDLAGFCERIALDEHLLDEAANLLEDTVGSAAGELRDALAPDRSALLEAMAGVLHQADGPQTTRMGVAIVANALLFQTAAYGTGHERDGFVMPEPDPRLSRNEVLSNWEEILAFDYAPIFATAYKVLKNIPCREAKPLISVLSDMACKLAGYGIVSAGEMAGQMFGKLIADRKFLATFYTRPAAAYLLAEIAAARLSADWFDAHQVTSLRVADLACGTGTLLTAAYQRIASRVRRAGADDAAIHPEMMEKALVGADIMPAAVHLTATLLSFAHPGKVFDRTGIFLMPYGRSATPNARKRKDKVVIGSLEMLARDVPDDFGAYEDWNHGWSHSGSQVVEGTGDRQSEKRIGHGEADLVIMNPPFVGPTNHKTAAAQGVPVPSFAGFRTEKDEQKLMSAKLEYLNRKLADRVGDGNAGLGSNFIDLAHVKVKPGGVIAFVLPFTVVSGHSWSKTRKLLAEHYRDICVVSIAVTGSKDRAFSADTGMAEALIIATRRGSNEPDDADRHGGVLYVNLLQRPANLVEAVEAARRIVRIAAESARTQTPSGSVDIGDTPIGNYIRAEIGDGGCAAIAEPDLAVCARAAYRGVLWLPRLGEIAAVPLTELRALGTRGPVHRGITGLQADRKTPRGPFEKESLVVKRTGKRSGRATEELKDWRAVTYPMLWAHKAQRERRLVVPPDSQGRVRHGYDEKARRIWDTTASRLHFNLDFQLNSQPLAACFTEQPSIGGRAWPTFKLHDERQETAVLLWANTTLGLISFWWIGSRQQQGRANLTITRLPALATLDARALSDDQLSTADAIFERFKERKLLPANEAYQDETRQDLDEAVLIDLVGQDKKEIMVPLALLRNQWCREPSVHGGKSTKPR